MIHLSTLFPTFTLQPLLLRTANASNTSSNAATDISAGILDDGGVCVSATVAATDTASNASTKAATNTSSNAATDAATNDAARAEIIADVGEFEASDRRLRI